MNVGKKVYMRGFFNYEDIMQQKNCKFSIKTFFDTVNISVPEKK